MNFQTWASQESHISWLTQGHAVRENNTTEKSEITVALWKMGVGIPTAASLLTWVIQSGCAVRDGGANDVNITRIEQITASLHFRWEMKEPLQENKEWKWQWLCYS